MKKKNAIKAFIDGLCLGFFLSFIIVIILWLILLFAFSIIHTKNDYSNKINNFDGWDFPVIG